MNSFGSARDIILISVVLFVVGIGFFIFNFIGHTAVDGMLAVPVFNDSNASRTALISAEAQFDRFDYIGFGVFIGLSLVIIISGWMVGGYPVFMFIYFAFVFVSVVLSMVFANTWETVSQSSVFGLTINSFPLLNHILSYLPVYVAAIGIVGLMAMFSRPFMGGGGGGGGGRDGY